MESGDEADDGQRNDDDTDDIKDAVHCDLSGLYMARLGRETGRAKVARVIWLPNAVSAEPVPTILDL